MFHDDDDDNNDDDDDDGDNDDGDECALNCSVAHRTRSRFTLIYSS